MPRRNKAASDTNSQSKLTDFRIRSRSQTASEANMAEGGNEERNPELERTKADQILAAIGAMKDEFSTRFDGIGTAIGDIQKEMSEFTERMSQVELRTSRTEDDVASLQAKVNALEAKQKTMEDKLLDLETRSRLNNLRLVGLPEGAEGDDPCAFLEEWIPEALNLQPRGTTVKIERAHRVGPAREPGAPPRTLIMKFLNFKEKQAVVMAAKTTKDIQHKGKKVRFFPDIATGLHQLRKQFDSVRQELRNRGIRHGLIHPAKLLVTYKERSHTFKTPAEARKFLEKIQEDTA